MAENLALEAAVDRSAWAVDHAAEEDHIAERAPVRRSWYRRVSVAVASHEQVRPASLEYLPRASPALSEARFGSEESPG